MGATVLAGNRPLFSSSVISYVPGRRLDSPCDKVVCEGSGNDTFMLMYSCEYDKSTHISSD